METLMYFIEKPAVKILSLLICIILLESVATGMGTSQKLPHIVIESQEAKLSPMIIGSASVFMKIANSGEAEDILTGVKLDIPGAIAEMHDTKDGKMIRVEKVSIPANETVELKPGGMHIMIFHLPEDTKEGLEFNMHLQFERSGERQIRVQLTGTDAHMHMHH
jgi:copper(I)-binding protein